MRSALKILSVAAGALAGAYIFDVYLRDRIAGNRARRLALQRGKPMIVVGSGTTTSSATGAKLWGAGIIGSVHCDLAASASIACSPETVCQCDAQSLRQFSDKQFSVALASNVLRYVPDRVAAEQELQRIADTVIVSDHWFPWIQIGAGSKRTLNGLPCSR